MELPSTTPRKVSPSHTPAARAAYNRLYRTRFTDEQWRSRRRAERERNKATYLAWYRRFYVERHEHFLAQKAIWRERNRERLREDARRYYREHPVEYAAWRDARRARIAGVPGTYTPQEWYELIKRYDFRCGYCGKRKPLVGDHRIPLSRVELHPTNDITNIIPSCVFCNLSKHDKTESEFRSMR